LGARGGLIEYFLDSFGVFLDAGNLDIRILKFKLVIEINRIDIPGDEPFFLVQFPIENGCQRFDWHFGRFGRLKVYFGEDFSRRCCCCCCCGCGCCGGRSRVVIVVVAITIGILRLEEVGEEGSGYISVFVHGAIVVVVVVVAIVDVAWFGETERGSMKMGLAVVPPREGGE